MHAAAQPGLTLPHNRRIGHDRHADSKLFITGLRGHTAEVTGISWSPDGDALATACDDRTVRVFDLRDPTAKTIPLRKKELRCGVQDVAFGDDSSHVAVQARYGAALAPLCACCAAALNVKSQTFACPACSILSRLLYLLCYRPRASATLRA